MSRRLPDLLALAALAILATVYLWPVVGGGECLARGDLINQYLPYRHVVNESLRAGEWPWWNPWSFSGASLVGNLNAAIFYPPNLLSIALPLERWFGWTVWLHVIWGLAGVHLFLRRAGLSSIASMIGAVTLWASGFFIFNLHSGIILFHQAGAWWPWAMLGALSWSQTGRTPWLALLSASLALMFLAGAPQIAYYAAGTAILLGITMSLGQTGWRRLLIGLAGAVALTGLLVQVQLLPAQESSAVSQRATWEGESAWELQTGDSLMPRSLLLALVPTVCGNPADEGTYWGTTQGVHEVVPALLTPALLLIIAGIFLRRGASAVSEGAPVLGRTPQWMIFHLILGLLALAAAFGSHSPIFKILWHTVPGFQSFRVPARASLVTLWCVVCLSAAMLDHLRWASRSPERSVRRRVTIGGGVVLGMGLAALIAFTLIPTRAILEIVGAPPGLEPHLQRIGLSGEDFLRTHFANAPELLSTAREGLLRWGLVVAITGLGIILWPMRGLGWLIGLSLLAAAMLQSLPPRGDQIFTLAEDFHATLYPESDAVEIVRANLGDGRLLCLDSVYSHQHDQEHPELFPNRPLLHGIPDARGYDPIISLGYVRWINAMGSVPPDTQARGTLIVPQISLWEFARAMNIHVIAGHTPLDASVAELIHSEPTGFRIHRLREPGRPGRWVTSAVAGIPDPLTNIGLVLGMRSDLFDPSREVLITGPEPLERRSEGEPSDATVTLIERGFSHVTYGVQAPEGQQGFLVTDIPYHVGWRARANGEPVSVLEGNTLWTTVIVPGGDSQVVLRFRPTSVVRGGLLSLAGLLIALGLCLAGRGKEKGEDSSEPSPQV
jgi:hypothetical protein